MHLSSSKPMSIESLRHVITSMLLATIVLAAMPSVAQQPTPDLRVARARVIGTEIGRAGDYTVYSPQATPERTCPASYRQPASPPTAQQMQQYQEALTAAKKRIYDEHTRRSSGYSVQLQALQKEIREGRIDQSEFNRRSLPLNQARGKIDEWRRAEETKEEEKLSAPLRQAMRSLQLNLEHAPPDPMATIVPLDAQFLPTAPFQADLNRALSPFLETCGDSDDVVVAHYFRDLFPNGPPQGFEPPITSYRYALKNGSLRVNEPNIGQDVFRAKHDPDRNPRLRLAIYKERIGVRLAETSRIKAEYRADFQHASKRKAGIVYKYDAFWAQYPRSDLARRIFDGDFARYASTVNFRWLYLVYGDHFSQRCSQHVASWTTIYEPVSEQIGTTENPVTGLSEPMYRDSLVPVRLDGRFAPQYNTYWATMKLYALQKALEVYTDRSGPSIHTMSTAQFLKKGAAFVDGLSPDGLDFRFLDRHACDSAIMTQLGENIARAARGQPSLQAAGVRLPNADQESDPARVP